MERERDMQGRDLMEGMVVFPVHIIERIIKMVKIIMTFQSLRAQKLSNLKLSVMTNFACGYVMTKLQVRTRQQPTFSQ